MSTGVAIALAVSLSLAGGWGIAGHAFAAAGGDASRSDQASASRPGQTRDVRVGDLLGAQVLDRAGRSVGQIADLVVNVEHARVGYAVLSLRQLSALGARPRVAIPAVLLKTSATDTDGLVADVDSIRLEGAPPLAQRRDSAWNNRYMREVDRYFGLKTGNEPSSVSWRRASEVIGTQVKGRDGEDLGNIVDLVMVVGHARIRYAVLEFDRPGSLKETAVMVPLPVFQFSAGRSHAVMNIDRASLDRALTFDKNRWPNINNPLFLVDVERYLVLVDPRMEYRENSGPNAIFDRLDVNGDNQLTADEARLDSKVLGVWRQMDEAGAGTITRGQFVARYRAVVEAAR